MVKINQMLLTRQSAKTKAERGEKNFHKAVQVVKVAEHSFGRL